MLDAESHCLSNGIVFKGGHLAKNSPFVVHLVVALGVTVPDGVGVGAGVTFACIKFTLKHPIPIPNTNPATPSSSTFCFYSMSFI